MFKKGEIWAYPTDTSFGLGVRADDTKGLTSLMELKHRSGDKYFSLMVRDWKMLMKFAEVPEDRLGARFFMDQPRTAILKPKKGLPNSPYWPKDKVAFRICTIPDIAKKIKFPVTATSANISGHDPIYLAKECSAIFGSEVKVYDKMKKLSVNNPSEIWDFTGEGLLQIR